MDLQQPVFFMIDVKVRAAIRAAAVGNGTLRDPATVHLNDVLLGYADAGLFTATKMSGLQKMASAGLSARFAGRGGNLFTLSCKERDVIASPRNLISLRSINFL